MMTSGDDDEEQFFDSREDSFNYVDPWHQIWTQNPDSVKERREKFLRLMSWDLTHTTSLSSDDSNGESSSNIDRIMSDSGAVLRSSDSENAPSMPSYEGSSEENSSTHYRIKNLGDVKDHIVTSHDLERSFIPSFSFQKLMRRGDSSTSSNSDKSERRRMGWLKRLGVAACIVDRQGEEMNAYPCDSDLIGSTKNQRVKVRPYRKKSKELSAVFMGQDIKAHDGAILTMKFSPDGQYLATGGEDGIVRVWHVAVHDRTDEDELPEDEPSCIYFKVNHNSELVPLYAEKEKKVKSGIMKRASDPACVVVPSEVFLIDEKPVHEFHGHQGDVLDLSWSQDKHLLSSSMDKTARLWRVGCDSCLGVFSHSNYVTCLQFNPVNENYFISGSIDGKVRLWEIPRVRVVDWIDFKEIISAICYRPDGKAGVVGTISGVCRFFDASDNHLQLDAVVPLQGKKKSSCKRITGFEFSPDDQRKLMITSADSQVRVLDGVDVVSKYKGLHNSGSQISASFTSDGRHIISASEDSNIYMWSYNDQNAPISKHVKTTWSCEHFSSIDASIAISWNGYRLKNPAPLSSEPLPPQQAVARDPSGTLEDDRHHLYLSPAGSFTLSQDLLSEFLPKGSATWPEEKLPPSSTAGSGLCKSEYKFLKASCQKESSVWGQVIVTAGLDGRIRSFRNYGLPVDQ